MTYAAIFDLDGTLIDTPNAIVTMMVKALHEMGVAPPDEAVIRSTIGLPLEVGAARILGVSMEHSEIDRLVELYRHQFLNWMVPMARQLLFVGVEDGLARLQSEGALLGLATSKYHRSAEAVLKSAGIWHFFSAVAGSDSVVRQKPDKEMAEHVAATLGCARAQCVVVGDTVHDLKMGRAAGMRILAVSYGVGRTPDLQQEGPDAIAGSFPEVVSILGALEEERTLEIHI